MHASTLAARHAGQQRLFLLGVAEGLDGGAGQRQRGVDRRRVVVRGFVAVGGLPTRRSSAAAVLDGGADREIAARAGAELMRPFERLGQPGEIGRIRVRVGVAHLVAEERLHFRRATRRVRESTGTASGADITLPVQCRSLRPVGSISSVITPTTPAGWSCRWRSISARPSSATGAATPSCCGPMRARASRTSPSRCPIRRRSLPEWARYVAGVVAELHPRQGFAGDDHHHVAAGCGSVVERVARGRGRAWPSATSATRCDSPSCASARSNAAPGVPCGIMDQLVVAARRRGSRAVDRLPLARAASGEHPRRRRDLCGALWRATSLDGFGLRRTSRRLRRGRSDHRPVARGGARSRRADRRRHTCAGGLATSSPRTAASVRSRRAIERGDYVARAR